MAEIAEEALQSVSKGMNEFAQNFYKILSESKLPNIVCSPTSVSLVLSMVAFGAAGKTEQELRAGLRLAENDEINHKGFRKLIENFNAIKKVDLRVANKIFIDSDFKLKDDFQEILKKTFESASEYVDFKNPENASRVINNWCEKQTNNRIRDLVQPSDFAMTRLVLVNAVCFKGSWRKKFDSKLTKPMPFHVNKQLTKNVPMMKQTNKFNYGPLPQLDAVYIELPYQFENAEDAMSMFIILPNEVDGLERVERNMDNIDFRSLHYHNFMTEIILTMPKFKIESQFDLQDPLTKLNMGNMFHDDADFSRMSDLPLNVSKVIQKAFLEVNEEGSEAAAATAVMIALKSCTPALPMSVTVDKPFLCVIIAMNTGLQLFIGHVTDPTS